MSKNSIGPFFSVGFLVDVTVVKLLGDLGTSSFGSQILWKMVFPKVYLAATVIQSPSTLEVNHDLRNFGSFWMMIHPFPKNHVISKLVGTGDPKEPC